MFVDRRLWDVETSGEVELRTIGVDYDDSQRWFSGFKSLTPTSCVTVKRVLRRDIVVMQACLQDERSGRCMFIETSFACTDEHEENSWKFNREIVDVNAFIHEAVSGGKSLVTCICSEEFSNTPFYLDGLRLSG